LLSLALAAHVVACGASARADPNAESKGACIKSYEEAQRLRGASRLLAARRELVACRQTCPASLEGDCTQWLEDTERRLATIVVVARSAEGSEVDGVAVLQDEERVADRLDGRPLSVDPGLHRLRFSTSGGSVAVQEIALGEGEKDHRIEVRFAAPPRPAEVPPAETRLVWWPPTAALVSFGVGLVGLTVGLSAGAAAIGERNGLQAACDPSGGCPPSESGQLSGYRSLTTLSTVGYVVGAAGLLGGVAIWLSFPRRAAVAAWVAPNAMGVSGAF
jgi:hypothetical protein